jgi:hypothetical protein
MQTILACVCVCLCVCVCVNERILLTLILAVELISMLILWLNCDEFINACIVPKTLPWDLKLGSQVCENEKSMKTIQK